MFSSRRSLVLTAVGVLVALPLGGLMFEAYADARAAREFPAPGTLVDMGGRRLHLVCMGSGDPTVVFEASGWGNSLSSSRARDRISARARVCSYDRIGMGWSDPGPGPMTPADLARDLAVLQDRARLGSPLVLVASSVGGLTAEMFARQYPERVAGLVFLDAASSEVLPAVRSLTGVGTFAACTAGFLARFGAIRVMDPFGLDLPDAPLERRRSAALTYGARPWATICAIVRGLRQDPSAFDRVPPLPADVPLLVLSASSGEGLFPGSRWLPAGVAAERVASHRRLAQRSHRGAWRTVPDSTHLIAESQPDVVADAVLTMVNDLK
jgi:pimeloyl-ACP methyl ester carboxylesterase